MKLISMIDFVLEATNNIENDWLDSDRVEELKKISNYANFLNQPLKLEMFICSVPEPEIVGGYSEDGNFVGGYDEKWIEEYYEAKDKVLFENYSVVRQSTYSIVVDSHGRNVWLSWNESKTIESLINEVTEVSLTPNAIKRIFG